MKNKIELKPQNALEKDAAIWLKKQSINYDNGIEGALDDLMRGGCASGIVKHLIYYSDTRKFYTRHKKEITLLLSQILDGFCPSSVFGKQWDKEDPLALEDKNQNLLAWFGFEESARNVCARAGIEI